MLPVVQKNSIIVHRERLRKYLYHFFKQAKVPQNVDFLILPKPSMRDSMDECDEGKDNEGKFTENERWKNLGNFLFSVMKM